MKITNIKKNKVHIGYAGPHGRQLAPGASFDLTAADLTRRGVQAALKLDISRGNVAVSGGTTMERALLEEAKIPTQAVSDEVKLKVAAGKEKLAAAPGAPEATTMKIGDEVIEGVDEADIVEVADEDIPADADVKDEPLEIQTPAAAAEEPKAEEPKAEEPTEEPKAEEPKAEEPTEEPKAEEPAEEPKAEEPAAEEPTTEPTKEPKAEEPKAEEPKPKPRPKRRSRAKSTK